MVTAFPSFQPSSNSTPLYYISYCNTSLDGTAAGHWGDGAYQGSTSCGMPLLLLDGDGNTLVISPLNNSVVGFQGISAHLNG